MNCYGETASRKGENSTSSKESKDEGMSCSSNALFHQNQWNENKEDRIITEFLKKTP